MDDLINDLTNDIEENQNSRIIRERRTSIKTISHGKSLVFLGAGLLVLIVFVLLLLLGGNGGSEEELTLIQSKLTRLEGILNETGALEDRIQQIEEQQMGVRQSIIKTDRTMRSLRGDLAQLAEAFENSRKKATQVPQKVPVQEPVPVKVEKISTPEEGYHVISRGETLYRISKQYGISVDELRRLNNMDPSTLIYPGQKLLVKPKTVN